MRKRGGGYIFNISSLAGVNAFPGGSAYNASKFGLNGFSEAMMQDVRYDGIRVSYIMPGSVDTDFGGAPGERPRQVGSLPARTSPKPWLTSSLILPQPSPAASKCGPRSLRERSECWPTPRATLRGQGRSAGKHAVLQFSVQRQGTLRAPHSPTSAEPGRCRGARPLGLIAMLI